MEFIILIYLYLQMTLRKSEGEREILQKQIIS